MWRLQFLGATGTVTGSKYLLHTASQRLLIDCGLFQGYKQLRLRNWSALPFKPNQLNAVVLTHAHLDHSGYLPLLVKHGFTGPIYCTAATRDLCEVLLVDSGKIQEEEAEYANHHSFSKHKPALPLYTQKDARRCLKSFKPVGFNVETQLGHKLSMHLRPAGHILGAASISLHVGGRSVFFSGDLGRPNDIVMNPPAVPEAADYLIVESTYGNRTHNPVDPRKLLAKVINRTIQRGGVVIIPTFAVGRAQTLLYYIHLLKAANAIPAVLPVFLDSPMAVDATHIFHQHHGEYRLSPAECEAMCKTAHIINTVEESNRLHQQIVPMIILAGSGMAAGGRVIHHLEVFAPDHRNTILFSGFQAGGTRGAAMLEGAREIKIHGNYVPVRAEIVALDNLSAHADANEILLWLKQSPYAPLQTFITHGEPAAADTLRLRIQDELGWSAYVPDYLETINLT